MPITESRFRIVGRKSDEVFRSYLEISSVFVEATIHFYHNLNNIPEFSHSSVTRSHLNTARVSRIAINENLEDFTSGEFDLDDESRFKSAVKEPLIAFESWVRFKSQMHIFLRNDQTGKFDIYAPLMIEFEEKYEIPYEKTVRQALTILNLGDVLRFFKRFRVIKLS